MITTIQIDNKTKNVLDSFKVHPRESYNELIKRILSNCNPKNFSNESLIETIATLSDPEEMREIAQSLEEFQSGKRGKTLEEIKRELKL